MENTFKNKVERIDLTADNTYHPGHTYKAAYTVYPEGYVMQEVKRLKPEIFITDTVRAFVKYIQLKEAYERRQIDKVIDSATKPTNYALNIAKAASLPGFILLAVLIYYLK